MQLLGFEEMYWEKLGEAFVELISLRENVRKHHEGVKAWTMLITAMVDRLKAGFRKRKRIQKQKVAAAISINVTESPPHIEVTSDKNI